MLKKLRDKIQAAIAESQPVEHHRQHGLTQGHAGMDLLIQAIKILYQPNLLTDSSHKPQMIQPFHRKI